MGGKGIEQNIYSKFTNLILASVETANKKKILTPVNIIERRVGKNWNKI